MQGDLKDELLRLFKAFLGFTEFEISANKPADEALGELILHFFWISPETGRGYTQTIAISLPQARALRGQPSSIRTFVARECAKFLDEMVWLLEKEVR